MYTQLHWCTDNYIGVIKPVGDVCGPLTTIMDKVHAVVWSSFCVEYK